MGNPEDRKEKEFAYESQVDRFDPFDLKTGDYIYIFSVSGSIYGFTVTSIDEFNVFVECVSGGFEGDRGEIRQKEVCVGERFRFGDNKTSYIKRIIISERELGFNFPQNEYGSELRIADSENFTEGDYIHMLDEDGNYYVVKVSTIDCVAEEVYLEPILVRYKIRDKLRSRLIGQGLRFSAEKLKSISTIERLQITRSADEVYDVTRDDEIEEERKWLPPEVLVSGISHIYSQAELKTLNILGLSVENLTRESLQTEWALYSKKYREIIFTSHSGKADKEAEFQVVKVGYEFLMKRFNRDTN